MEGGGVSADTNDNLNDDRVCKRSLRNSHCASR